jgi:uncharacterized membrane protein
MATRKLHSGYRNNRRNNNRRPNNGGSHKLENNANNVNTQHSHLSAFPPPSILQEYEYATEGAADRILEMAEVEQDRRNDWEDDYLAYYKKSLRIGQLFGFILLLCVVLSFLYLVENGHEVVAVYLAFIGFFSVALANFFSLIGRIKPLKRSPRVRK